METYGEGECGFDGFRELLRMSHISVDVGKDRVTAPWRHQQAEGEREGEPVRGEEIGLSWFPERSWRVRLN